MPVIISMLRGVNVGGRHQIKMDALRVLYESLGLRDVRTHIQSGNAIFRAPERDVSRLAKRIEDAIERSAGFRPHVVVRTSGEMRAAIANNPFAARRGLDPSKLLVVFLSRNPTREARDRVLGIQADPEEFEIAGREVYIYYPNGMARPKLPWTTIEKMLDSPGTGRNWNTVNKLLEIAETLEAS